MRNTLSCITNFCYTTSLIMRNTLSYVREMFVVIIYSLIMTNKYFNYTSSRII